ncbi:MAG: hypothetical protein M1820_003788 [Bogoriella megaspora]|nr:MAG: hypothetical protein M1820_003788 [Bogoriella megaspora]
MATAQEQNDINAGLKESNGSSSHDHADGVSRHRKQHEYGGNPLAHINTGDSARLAAFGGEFQPGLYKPIADRKIANPAPLGLCAFALTTFVLSLINMRAKDITEPNIVVAAAYGYGGLVQLLAGMWEMAIGNTFGATALSSYGGFWISFAIIFTPGGFNIASALETADNGKPTMLSTVAFFLLFLTLDMAFLMLSIAYVDLDASGDPRIGCVKAGGAFGILSAFLAWYNALAGIADTSNSFFLIPVAHFPWSEKGRELRAKSNADSGADKMA